MKSLTDHARSFAATHVADPRNSAAFRALGAGQTPEVLFITCSDSRVVPALITGARPGELFELRTAGNVIPPYPGAGTIPASEAATVEYAVCVLGVRDIVVCGHSHCGAVGALARGDDLSAVPAVRDWLEHSVAPDDAVRSLAPTSADVAEAVQAHALAQLERLRTYPCVRERTADGSLTLHAWYYEVHTGAVTAHRPSCEQPHPTPSPAGAPPEAHRPAGATGAGPSGEGPRPTGVRPAFGPL